MAPEHKGGNRGRGRPDSRMALARTMSLTEDERMEGLVMDSQGLRQWYQPYENF